jgi:hypothetical protein
MLSTYIVAEKQQIKIVFKTTKYLIWSILLLVVWHHAYMRGRRRRDRMVVGFTTTYAISVYHL